MYPDEKVELGSVTIIIDGEVVGTAESITANVNVDDVEISDNNFNFSKSFEGTLEIESFNEELFEHLGLYEWQKALMRRELHKQRLESAKEKNLGMRESINNHFKRGKKW